MYNNMYDFAEFTNPRRIGEGGNGVVYSYIHIKDGVEKAIKELKQDEQVYLDVEVYPLLRLVHPNIVLFYGVTKVIKPNGTEKNGIVMEVMKGKDLREVIKSGECSVEDILKWNMQSAAALEHMHSLNFLHRDIKPTNMLLDAERKTLKICDFGFVKETEGSFGNTAEAGTKYYWAPEVHNGDRYHADCDVFSWALTFWECFLRRIPFIDCQPLPVLERKKKDLNYLCDVPNASPKFNRILKCCRNPRREKRLSIGSMRILLEIMLKNGPKKVDEAFFAKNICLRDTTANYDKVFYCEDLAFQNWDVFDKELTEKATVETDPILREIKSALMEIEQELKLRDYQNKKQ